MIFELRDLKFATPATATRAGILYISEGRQWANMVASWLGSVARPYAEKAKWKVGGQGARVGGARASVCFVAAGRLTQPRQVVGAM